MPRWVGALTVRDHMMPDAWYLALDAGIRFPVRVLHAAGGIETCQSCEGGAGHAYHAPSIDLIANGEGALGFRALAALSECGIDVWEIALVWLVRHGLPVERVWRITLRRAYPERADERPIFISRYEAT